MATLGASFDQSAQFLQLTKYQSLLVLAVLDEDPNFYEKYVEKAMFVPADVEQMIEIKKKVKRHEESNLSRLENYLHLVGESKLKDEIKSQQLEIVSLIDSAHVSYFAQRLIELFKSENEQLIIEELEKNKGTTRLNKICNYKFSFDRSILHLVVLNRMNKVLEWLIQYFDNRESKVNIEDRRKNYIATSSSQI